MTQFTIKLIKGLNWCKYYWLCYELKFKLYYVKFSMQKSQLIAHKFM